VRDPLREDAARMRALLLGGGAPPDVLRSALAAIPPGGRDGWVDRLLGIETVPDDGPDLPRGCVPYLPCSVDVLLRAIELAGLDHDDVFVDVGSGLGRAAVLIHLLTGAEAVGIEIQAGLVGASRDLAARLNATRVSIVQGDAAALPGSLARGTVFLLYCPFGGDRLESVLSALESIATARPIRVCCVDLPLPPRAWLAPVSPRSGDLAVYRSTSPGGG
jgi:SAM-dependent methyltransferase